MSRKKLFKEFRMELTQVLPSGTEKEPQAYLYLEAELEDDDLARLGLADLRGVEIIDHNKKVHLEPDALNYGEGFTIEVKLAPQNEEQEELFEPVAIIEEVEAVKLASVGLTKKVLVQSILLNLSTCDVLYELLEYAKKKVYVTITQGKLAPKQMEIDA